MRTCRSLQGAERVCLRKPLCSCAAAGLGDAAGKAESEARTVSAVALVGASGQLATASSSPRVRIVASTFSLVYQAGSRTSPCIHPSANAQRQPLGWARNGLAWLPQLGPGHSGARVAARHQAPGPAPPVDSTSGRVPCYDICTAFRGRLQTRHQRLRDGLTIAACSCGRGTSTRRCGAARRRRTRRSARRWRRRCCCGAAPCSGCGRCRRSPAWWRTRRSSGCRPAARWHRRRVSLPSWQQRLCSVAYFVRQSMGPGWKSQHGKWVNDRQHGKRVNDRHD